MAASTSAKPEMSSAQESTVLISYRAVGLGVYGALLRWVAMPLEKLALFMNSDQVSGKGQLQQAWRLTFAEGSLGPYRVVGRASLAAWFMQYSVMGFVFQVCDSALSQAFGVPRITYGKDLMKAAEPSANDETPTSTGQAVAGTAKLLMAPAMAGTIESAFANRAEVQRYYGIERFRAVEAKLAWSPVARFCGPAFVANASRNFIMSSTSFVLTPTVFKTLPQEYKSEASLFWLGLGMNVFVGNNLAIWLQALWGRSLSYAAVDGGRNISYISVVREGLKTDGLAAFYTPAKWFSRVLMNAPAQGTLPWFYNQVLPLGEDRCLSAVLGATGMARAGTGAAAAETGAPGRKRVLRRKSSLSDAGMLTLDEATRGGDKGA